MYITLNYETLIETCPCCEEEFVITRGWLSDEGQPCALYLAGLHACDGGPFARLAIAIDSDAFGASERAAAALNVWPTETEIQMSFRDWVESPFDGEDYLGLQLDRADALAHPLKDAFLHLADHIVAENPEVHRYLYNDETG